MSSREAFTDYVDYARFLAGTTAYYLDAKAEYDPMSVFLSSKIDPVPYQIYDFNRLINEDRTQGNMRALIAYETGLGKTILVGMIINELLTPRPQDQFHKPKRILIATPPTVLPQFKDEMETKFGLDFKEFDSQNPVFHDKLIASMDTLKFEPWKTRLENQTWDLVVVDEYHKVSPDTLRGELFEVLTRKTEHFLALTATPHDGKSDRFEYRMDIIAPHPLTIRRTKREAIDINNKKLFDHTLHEIKEGFPVTSEELSFYSRAEEYAKERFKGSGAGALVAIVIGRAVSSSIRAGVKLFKNRRNKLLTQQFEEEHEEYYSDLFERVNEGRELSEQDIESILSAKPENREELEAELALLNPVLRAGEELVSKMPVDSKGKYLLDLLEEIRDRGEKCLVFTNFLETVDYLNELVEDNGYNPLVITGDIPMDERNRIVKRFTEQPRYDLIIGTDAMGESLNLQAASVEINYDVPWSPVSYIQRVGRIWRFGQKQKVLFIHNFLPAFDVEKRVMEVMLEKIDTINQEFGEVGLSVFGKELGSIDEIVRRSYQGEDSRDQVESAYQETRKIGRKVIEVMKKSMTLPRVVNVEELQRNNIVNMNDAFSERDLRHFLEYLKDAGYASGSIPEEERGESTYHVKTEDGYVRVESLSLKDRGVKTAIELGKKLLEVDNHVSFNHHKNMTGKLVTYETRINGETVYEEPVLVTPEGVLTYRGILNLAPDFTDKHSDASFMTIEEYKEKTGNYWLDFQKTLWNDIRQMKQDNILQEQDEYRKEWLRKDLQKWLRKKPEKAEVIRKRELGKAGFSGRWSEDKWRARQQVEMTGMKAATEYYESKGYTVSDVSQENRGYDILCKKPDGILRVEVKGLETMPCPQLSDNEYRAAEFYEDSFILFIVKIMEQNQEKYEIPDPVNNIEFTEIQKPVYIAKGFETFKV